MGITRAPDPLRWAAERYPQETALDCAADRITFGSLDSAVDRLCGIMTDVGVRARRPVMVAAPDDDALLLLLILAAWRVGAVAAPVPDRLPESGVDAMSRALGRPLELRPGEDLPDGATLWKTVRSGRSVPPVRPPSGVRRRATALATSGTSGAPKIVVHRLRAHVLSAVSVANHVGYSSGKRWLHTLGPHHVGGLAPLVRTFAVGGTLVVPERRRLDHRLLTRSRATHVSLVGTQLSRLVEEGGPPDALECALVGGGPVDLAVVDAAIGAGWPIVLSYGMTETASAIAATRPLPEDGGNLAGVALPHATVAVTGEGEVLVRGPSLLDGYWRDGTVWTARDASGWFRTRDRGTLDSGGRLRITGRMDRQFVSGGENIRPESIEGVLMQVPGVGRAIVVPVADRKFGERPLAFVEGSVPVEVLREAVRGALPSFMVPVAFLPFPETGSKPSMAELRTRADVWRRSTAATPE